MNDSQQTFILDARYAKTNFSDQLDRIESKLDELLARKKRVKGVKGAWTKGYDESFEAIWAEYPKVSGANKKLAYAAYEKRLSEVNEPLELVEAMFEAVKRYAKFCEVTERFVMLPATFFGPAQHYLDDFTIPAGAIKSQIPKDNEEMQRWAIKRGLRPAYQTESWAQYRAFVEDAS